MLGVQGLSPTGISNNKGVQPVQQLRRGSVTNREADIRNRPNKESARGLSPTEMAGANPSILTQSQSVPNRNHPQSDSRMGTSCQATIGLSLRDSSCV